VFKERDTAKWGSNQATVLIMLINHNNGKEK
jgi:hypothetical protein